jgi:hypothetical protein
VRALGILALRADVVIVTLPAPGSASVRSAQAAAQ